MIYIRLLLIVNVGGGVVDGLLFDSFEIEPRVRFGARFGTSVVTLANFFSSSFGVCGRVLTLLLCGVDAFTIEVKQQKKIRMYSIDLIHSIIIQ